MTDENKNITVREGQPGWVMPTIVLVAILAVAGVGLGWRGSADASDTRAALSNDIQLIRAGQEKDMQTVQDRLATADKNNTTLQDDLTVVTKKLQITQGQLKKAREEAQQVREDATKQLAAMDDSVKSQLSTKASTDDVKLVSGEVGGVRTDLDATKTDLNTTKQNLDMARSELGTLIAKNHDEIDELRKLGERDYIEFTIDAKNKPQKIGNVSVELRATNPSKNQYNLALTVNDKLTEKKNRTINEPIFFYTHGSKQPMEIVVNSVEKNKVIGYLSIPKSAQQVTASTAGM
jgi:vacuolar-type H+-ATPase subunit D/Vma8